MNVRVPIGRTTPPRPRALRACKDVIARWTCPARRTLPTFPTLPVRCRPLRLAPRPLLAALAALVALAGCAPELHFDMVIPDHPVHDAVVDDPRVGLPIADFQLRNVWGSPQSLSDFDDASAVVVVFLGTECPLAQLYAPQLVRLFEQYAPRGVAFLGICSNRQDSLTKLQHYVERHRLPFPVLKDVGNVVADQFHAERTPEAFVLDRERVIRYCGRIDDKYGFQRAASYQRLEPRREDVAVALEELLAGREVSVPATRAPGCHIGRVREPDESSEVTWSNQIVRIFQQRCQHCHREGQIGPFPLITYDDVLGWEGMIAEVVADGRMPPWHANPEYGKFINDTSLTDDEKALIATWVQYGAPQGDPADLPPPREFADPWTLRDADQVVYIRDEPFTIPAEGVLEYQYLVVDPGITEDRWVEAVEARPDALAVVHHMAVFVTPPGDFFEHRREGRVTEIGGFVPGLHYSMLVNLTPEQVDEEDRHKAYFFIPAGSKIAFEMHYTANGTATTDRSGVALRFGNPPADLLPHTAASTDAEGDDVRSGDAAPNDAAPVDTAPNDAAPNDARSLAAAGSATVGSDTAGEALASSELAGVRQLEQATAASGARIAPTGTPLGLPPGREVDLSTYIESATFVVQSNDFAIPPEADNYPVEAWYTVTHDSLLRFLHIHMHWRGKSSRFIAHYPHGEQEILLDVPDYDFNWQNAYFPAETILLPRGTRIQCISHFDNSADNLRNPDPSQTVCYGKQTWEEMMAGTLAVFRVPRRATFRAAAEEAASGDGDAHSPLLEGYWPVDQVRPEHLGVYYYQRSLYRSELGDRAGALADLDRAVEADPAHAPAWLERGRWHESNRAWEAAIADFGRAAALAPGDPGPLARRGWCRHAAGDSLAALGDLNRAVELDRRYPDAYHYRGLARESLGDLSAALDDYTRLIDEIHPYYAPAYQQRGLLMVRLGRWADAQADFARCLELKPSLRRELGYFYGLTAFQLGDFDSAVTSFQEVLERDPQHAPANYASGLVWLQRAQLDRAAWHFQNVLKTHPEHTGALNNLGVVRLQQRRVDDAIAYFERSLATDADNPDTHNSLGIALLGDKQWRRAADHFREALRIKPDLADAQRNLQQAETAMAGEREPAENTTGEGERGNDDASNDKAGNDESGNGAAGDHAADRSGSHS